MDDQRTSSTDDFLARFAGLVVQARRISLVHALLAATLVAIVATITLASLDYSLELQQNARSVVVIIGLAVAAVCGIFWGRRAIRQSGEVVLASRLEQRFPELGQGIRTALQFRHATVASAASPALIAAMHSDINVRTLNTPLDDVLDRHRLKRLLVITGGFVGGIVVLTLVSWEWRLALGRATLSNQPYTYLALAPENAIVDEGHALVMVGTLDGRIEREVTLLSRPAGSGDAWISTALTSDEIEDEGDGHRAYRIVIPELSKSTEYKLEDGYSSSPVERIEVRHPLEVKQIAVELTPPEYTGRERTVMAEGSFRALMGSHATLRVTLDRPAASAHVQITDVVRSSTPTTPSETRVALQVVGKELQGELPVNRDIVYSIVGLASDQSPIRLNRFRVRVVTDQLPRVRFVNPPNEMQTHSLAEIPMKINVTDDFQVARAGIVFRINNGEEFTLTSLPKSATFSDATNLFLEKLLPLESLELSQKDSISYLAYVEDNCPEGFRRVETELRFLDVRPFRRSYREVRREGGGGAPRSRLESLESLIRRERAMLNRTLNLNRAAQRDERTNVDEVDDLLLIQEDTADLTRLLADAAAEAEAQTPDIEERVSDLLYDAEESMMRAVDSLSVNKFPPAQLQQTDAASSLVAARNAVELLLGQGSGSALRQLFRIDEELGERMRPRRTDDEVLEEIASRLRVLAAKSVKLHSQLQTLVDANVSPGEELLQAVLEEQQQMVDESQAIDRLLQNVVGATEQTLDRSTIAIDRASKLLASIEAKDFGTASPLARDASVQYQEFARNIEGLAPREPSGRIANARDFAAFVASQLRRAQQQLTVPDEDLVETPLDQQLVDLAETSATINDVLQSIVTTFSLDQSDVVERIGKLTTEADLSTDDLQLVRIAALLTNGEQQNASLELVAAAERFDQLAQRLDALHASLVSPRLTQVLEFERRASELQHSMNNVANLADLDRWIKRLTNLTGDIKEAEIELDANEHLRKRLADMSPMSAAGNTQIVDRSLADGATALVGALQAYKQQLTMGRIDTNMTGGVPPQYEESVRRYFELLSGEGGR